jgi:hypothetical protein
MSHELALGWLPEEKKVRTISFVYTVKYVYGALSQA